MCKVVKCAAIIWTVASVAGCDSDSSSRDKVQARDVPQVKQSQTALNDFVMDSLSSGLIKQTVDTMPIGRTNADVPEFVRIPAGINAGNDPDEGEYESKMSHDVFMDTTEVTFAKWRAVSEWAKTNGYEFVNGERYWDDSFSKKESNPKNDNLPVTGMTWYDCLKWCNARSEMDGLDPVYCVEGKPYRKGVCDPVADVAKSGWRLPTENEWRYAARGGKVGLRFPWGNTISHENANYSGKKDPAWPYDLSEGEHPIYKGSVAPVASFAPNGYGLYDMAGNAWEFAWGSSGKWIPVCGGCSSSLAHFLKIQHPDIREKGSRGAGFRTMRLVPGESRDDTVSVNLSAAVERAGC